MTTMNEYFAWNADDVYAYAYIFDLLKNSSNTRKVVSVDVIRLDELYGLK